MSYDTKAPQHLKKLQQWFGSIISRPIDEDSRINPLTPAGNPIEEESALYITPGPTLRPAQRIQMYNQQYWWRLLNTMHESFPLVTRLFGYYDFNKSLAIPYLVKYPPRHWSLSFLGDRFVQWLDEDYHASDKRLVMDAARVDWAFTDAFIAPELPCIDANTLADGNSLLTQKLYLQPHVHLFQMQNDIFSYRVDFMKQEPDYWVDNDFPELHKSQTGYYFLARNSRNDLFWHDISSVEYQLLAFFKKGTTIEHACDWLENLDHAAAEEASKKLHHWFQEWTKQRWLSVVEPTGFLSADL